MYEIFFFQNIKNVIMMKYLKIRIFLRFFSYNITFL